MLEEIFDWPKKIELGYTLAQETIKNNLTHTVFSKRYTSILFIGMGGSGITGALFATLLKKYAPTLATEVISSARIPREIQPNTLALVSSYSGNTWEVLDAYEQLKLKSIDCIIMTHGGTLLERGTDKKDIIFTIPFCSAPRASIGSSVGILAALFEHYHFLQPTVQLKNIISTVKATLSRFSLEKNFTPFIQNACTKKIVCLGVTDDSHVAAYRAQTQFNENSKLLVVHQNFPEFCHNGIVGIAESPHEYMLLLMHTSHLLPHEKQGIAALKAVLDDYQIPWYAVDVQEKEWESQLFELLLWADFASFYVGKAKNIEITAVKAIDALKKYFKTLNNS